MADKSLCSSCVNSIWCPTWAEWKCKSFEKRIREPANLKTCTSYKKRDKNFKDPECRCDDCLKNEMLWDEKEDNLND